MSLGEYLESQKSALRWDIKRTMRNLCQKLAEIGEECFIVSANPCNGVVGHMGSVRGDEYINEKSAILYDFLEYCRESDENVSECIEVETDEEMPIAIDTGDPVVLADTHERAAVDEEDDPSVELDLQMSPASREETQQESNNEVDKQEDGNDTDKSRFQIQTEEQLNSYIQSHQSETTKRNTKWAVKLFQDWHKTTYKTYLNFELVTESDLSDLLRKFYCEISPHQSEARSKRLGSTASQTYHRNTIKNARSGLARHLNDLNRNFDIVHGSLFRIANRTLDGFLKAQKRAGYSRPTGHKPVINKDDLKKISIYFKQAPFNPFVLRHCVWFYLGLHFLARGQQFYIQLQQNSFNFQTDDSGTEFVTLTPETQKNLNEGPSKVEASTDRRMCGIDSDTCPVKMLKLLMSKTNSSSQMLFNCCNQEAIQDPAQFEPWYNKKPLSKRSFFNFMVDICKASKTSVVYTPNSLRVTAIQVFHDK